MRVRYRQKRSARANLRGYRRAGTKWGAPNLAPQGMRGAKFVRMAAAKSMVMAHSGTIASDPSTTVLFYYFQSSYPCKSKVHTNILINKYKSVGHTGWRGLGVEECVV
mmetsp:Transcript_43045/g.63332  ORF Transcript_43045/g.63332 Transcript_43045/m.63332 type:complete len:108 (+) Transcript_43045:114-437(+)